MSPNHHPCIDTNKCESLSGISHHLVEEKTNTKKGITKKHAKLQYWKDLMLIEIKGYVKFVEHQLEKYMEYDDMNEDKVNLNGKHQ
jgi:hypothetical protein